MRLIPCTLRSGSEQYFPKNISKKHHFWSQGSLQSHPSLTSLSFLPYSTALHTIEREHTLTHLPTNKFKF